MSTPNHASATLLENTFGFRLPTAMRAEFENLVENSGKQKKHTLNAEELNELFCKEYIDNTAPFELTTINFEKEFVNTEQERLNCVAMVKKDGASQEIRGTGNGTLNALMNAFDTHFDLDLHVIDYMQHGLTQGSHALAASYLQVADQKEHIFWGVGIDSDSTLSAVRALLSAINRSMR